MPYQGQLLESQEYVKCENNEKTNEFCEFCKLSSDSITGSVIWSLVALPKSISAERQSITCKADTPGLPAHHSVIDLIAGYSSGWLCIITPLGLHISRKKWDDLLHSAAKIPLGASACNEPVVTHTRSLLYQLPNSVCLVLGEPGSPCRCPSSSAASACSLSFCPSPLACVQRSSRWLELLGRVGWVLVMQKV